MSRSSLRLLLAVDSLEVAGEQRHAADLARALRRRGYRVEVACSVAGGLAEDRVPDVAIFTTAKKLVPPSYAEGFDRLLRVRPTGDHAFEVRVDPP